MIVKLNDYLATPATCSTGYWRIKDFISPLNPRATSSSPNIINLSYDGVSSGSLINLVSVNFESKILNLTTGEKEVWIDLDNYEDGEFGEYVFIIASYYSNCGSNPCGTEEEIKINIQNTVTTDEFVTATTSNAYIGLDRLSGAANRRCNNSDEGTVGLIVNPVNEFEIQYYKTVKGDGVFTAVQENNIGIQNISSQVAPLWTYTICEDLDYQDIILRKVYYDPCINTTSQSGGDIDIDLNLSSPEITYLLLDGFDYGLQNSCGASSRDAYSYRTGMTVYITRSGPTNNLMTIVVEQKPHTCGDSASSWGLRSNTDITTYFSSNTRIAPPNHVSNIVVNPIGASINPTDESSVGTYCGDTLDSIIPLIEFTFEDGDGNIYSTTGESYVTIGGVTYANTKHVDYINGVDDTFQLTFDDSSTTRHTSCAAGAQARFMHNRDPLNVQSFNIYKNNTLLTGVATSPSAWYSYTTGDVFKTIVVTKNNPSCQLQKIFTF